MVDMARSGGLYILLISIHGLIRGHNLELGRDADTGGQTKYVVELAKALARKEGVERVDLVTRLVVDDHVSPDYAVPIEKLAENLQIVRVKAGPNEYLPKEQLWPHMDSFADHLSTWLAEQPRLPDVVHTHYADAGYVGVRLSNLTGLPLIHTGHSLGRDKYRRLLAVGMDIEQIEKRYHMQARISAEEDTLSCAELVITSTRNEIESQYELYDYYTPEKMAVIPPGTDLEQFHPHEQSDFRRTRISGQAQSVSAGSSQADDPGPVTAGSTKEHCVASGGLWPEQASAGPGQSGDRRRKSG